MEKAPSRTSLPLITSSEIGRWGKGGRVRSEQSSLIVEPRPRENHGFENDLEPCLQPPPNPTQPHPFCGVGPTVLVRLTSISRTATTYDIFTAICLRILIAW